MKKGIFRKIAALAVGFSIFFGSTAQVMAGEQLGATNFDDGVGLPWHIVESETGDMDFEIADGVYRITINNPGGVSNGGEDRWDCQFRHRGLTIVAGHQYQVHYEIKASNSGKYYTKIGNLAGDVEIWHNMSNGYDLDSTWDLININANETKVVDLTFTAGQSLDVAEWAFHLGGDGQYTNGVCFPAGTVIEFDNMSLIDLSSDENDYVAEPEWVRADIITNQVGYFPNCRKQATLITDSETALTFSLVDSNGQTVYEGESVPYGEDEDSGDNVHIIDFSDFNENGTYRIVVGDSSSREFDIGNNEAYSSLLYDSLNYFYQNRSGIEIESQYITSGDASALARAAGHLPDTATIDQRWGYTGSSGQQDVTGGWYDAGDHGKYVVNGGISLWTLQNQYEMAENLGMESAYADGTMSIPENSNGYPDLLDECRYEMEWMFTMLVGSGDYQDMVYHKVHDSKWTGLGLAPSEDEEERIICPPTTAATLNVAACAAQSARLWSGIDDDFSQECLDIAVRTYEAAKAHPDMYAPLEKEAGGGPYGDDNVTDEFYWAAMELYITTGDSSYYDDASSYDGFLDVPTELTGGESVDTVGAMDWGHVAALGTLSASLNGSSFSDADYEAIKSNIMNAADYFCDLEDSQGYGQPYGQSTLSYSNSNAGYIWGSNSFVVNNSMVIAYAYAISGEGEYLDGAISGMDYILGRNPTDYSYVTGYGTHYAQYPHHRYWAYQVDSSYPMAPSGVLVGGPNCGMEDPWVQGSGWHYGEIPAARCYMDNIEAYSTNECTINWNAPLSWLTGFVTGSSEGGINVVARNAGGSTVSPSADSSSNSGNAVSSNIVREEAAVPAVSSGSAVSDSKASSETPSWIPIAIIGGVSVTVIISIEIFLYNVFKMKYKSKGEKQ